MAIFNRLPNWALALLTPLLLSIAWPGALGYHEFPVLVPLMWVAMVPLLVLEARMREGKLRHFAGWGALSMVLFPTEFWQ